MVLGSQPRRVEIYPVPPWPSLAASMAAYRLRSFSESESWNIRIECSISGLYVMAGRPWRGLDCPCHGYTMRTADREVIESAILKGYFNSNLGGTLISPWRGDLDVVRGIDRQSGDQQADGEEAADAVGRVGSALVAPG